MFVCLPVLGLLNENPKGSKVKSLTKDHVVLQIVTMHSGPVPKMDGWNLRISCTQLKIVRLKVL